MEVQVENTIDADVGAVWDVLSDIRSWPQWNPVVTRIKAKAKAGARAIVSLKVGPGPALTIPVKLHRFDSGEISWKGAVPGVFSGYHYFRLEKAGDQQTRFTHGERFGGLLPKLTWNRMEAMLTPAYGEVNKALKQRVEGS